MKIKIPFHRNESASLRFFNFAAYDTYIKGSSIKYVRSDFVILERMDIIFKGEMTDIFCGLLAIKGPQIALENKETTVQSYQKMSNLNTKKSP